MKELEYPFDSGYIMKKKRSIRKQLLAELAKDENSGGTISKRIAVLGGSTTADIVSVLELFLLDAGIKCEFYQSEYGMYWQDAVFGNEELDAFHPDIIYIHTSFRNLEFLPEPNMTEEQVESGYQSEMSRFCQMWDSIEKKYGCPVIQNNFEQPYFRLLGNSDASDFRGRVNFVSRMNTGFYGEIRRRKNLYLNDINWLSSMYGLEKWSSPEYWYMYKYSLNISAIPDLCYQTASIIRSLFGRTSKALALDLDNTLWGGIVGDDGAENIVIGQESAEAMAFSEWQKYLKSLKSIGVLLTVCSKNEEENALAGLEHPEGTLRPDDFTVIKANWEPKDRNIISSAQEINIMPDAFVFADDNPAEREIVRSQIKGVKVPEIGEVTDYIRVIDRSEFFEVTALSEDDLKRNDMYKANAMRYNASRQFENYEDYLQSLEMQAEIKPFAPVYYQRIAQLTNKSNQFNLTTRRYTPAEIETFAQSDKFITLYGKLTDKFGDNGVVSVVIGEKTGENLDTLDIKLWLMSCRVLKRDMELAMLDSLVKAAKAQGISALVGTFIPTAKNKMVKDLYEQTFGFSPLDSNADGETRWMLCLDDYENKNKVIKINM